jgi:hypothetical protein
MPQGWSIRNLSCFNVILSGGYEHRPEPTGHATYPQPLATRLTKNINDENDNEKYYLTTKTKTKNPLMKRHCKLEGIYFSLPAFALSGN